MAPSAAKNIDARQQFRWVLVAELEMAPAAWGRPLRPGDVRAIAANFDPDKLGAIAVWHRPDLAPNHGRYVTLDGQHRIAAVRLMGYDDQRVPCLLYESLTIETAAELSLGLQERRNLHPLDKYRASLAAHDRRAVDIDKVLTHLQLRAVYTCKPEDRACLSAISQVGVVWDRMSAAGLERVLSVCGDAWDRTAAGFSANTLKLVMTLLAAHDGAIIDERLAETLGARSPAQWLAVGSVRRRAIASVAQDVIVEYNKHSRGTHRIEELTPTQYETAAKRSPVVTKRGTIDAPRQTSTSNRTRRIRPGERRSHRSV